MTETVALERYLDELARTDPLAASREAEVRTAVRGYLAAARAELARRHRARHPGRAVNEFHADLVDRLARRLFELAEAEYFAEGHRTTEPVAAAAVGGYARREMSVHSDVDLLLLHPGTLSPYLTRIAERLQVWLWDAGLSVGCATRSIEETVALAQADPTVLTAVLDTRFLAGSPELFHRFANAMRRELLADPAQFVERQTAALQARHARYGDSLYLLQPHVKEGAGGLRDYHAALWSARAAQPWMRGLDDLLHFGLLTESEMVDYRRSLNFLWRVRNELHLISARKNDRLSFEQQEHVAEAFGYGAGAGPEEALPVERFMRDYYRHARTIRHHSQLVIEQCRSRLEGPSRRAAPAIEVEDGFRLVGERLDIPHVAHLRDRPVRLLTAFAVAQDHDVELSRSAQRVIRESLGLVDDDLRTNRVTASALLRILNAERRVMRTLMTLNELGLLGRLLPEWDHIVCRWQHVIYHTYTVDVHSIFLVEELRRLWRGKSERALPQLTELIRSVEDRPVLFLGCLFHDLGKGLAGDHSRLGAERARACAERLGLAPERVERIEFLVRHHLLMSHLAQRRDLSDPRLILEFARTVGDRTNLRNLYLLTFADTRASSPSAWTEWKGILLGELFERTAEFLETGTDDPARALETVEAQVEQRQQAAQEELKALGVAEAKIEALFEIMPRRYFVSHTPAQIARHGLALLSFSEDRSAAVAVREMRGDFSELIVCMRDVHGLYARVAGTLTAKGINILGSNVYTTRSGVALEIYRVTTPRADKEERERVWREFEETLGRVLANEVKVEELLRGRRRPLGAPPALLQAPPTVLVANGESDFYTIVDVSANDRLGLLYDLTRTLASHGLEIYISKASTLLDQVADTFYVKDRRARKLTDPRRIEALREDLLSAAHGEGEGASG